MIKGKKILLVFDSPYFKPRGYDFKEEFRDGNWTTERDIYNVLKENSREVSILGLYDSFDVLLSEIRDNRPDVVFNLTEVFRQKSHLDKNVAWLLETMDIPYTGASPASLLICNNKALTKTILSYHQIRVPNFCTFYRNRNVWLPRKLRLPLIVKPLHEEASRGISQASVVDNEDSFVDRIKFINSNMNMDAIAEEYIEGRELYVSIMGNKKTEVLPIREMQFGQRGEDEYRIATYKAKWDNEYRKRWGVRNVFAEDIPSDLEKKIKDKCRKAYRFLNMRCYARFDVRVTKDEKVYIIEANANPSLQKADELAQSAARAGISYERLIIKILSLAFRRES